MPGVKGKSGGAREGAGRPILHFRLSLGQQYGFSEKAPNGFLPMKLGKVVELDKKLVVFEFDDGTRLTILR